MNPTAIFSKTGKGVQEASGKTSNLSRGDRAVLKEIDGKTAIADISVKFDKISADKFDALIQQFDKDGYIREVSSSSQAAATPARSVPPPKVAPPSGDSGGDEFDFTQVMKVLPKAPATGAGPRPPPLDLAAAARAESERKAKDEEAFDFRAREEAAAKAKAEAPARARAEAQARVAAKAEAEAKAKAEAEANDRNQANARALAEAEAKVKAAREAAVRMATEVKARAEAELNAKLVAERKAREDAERRAAEATELARKELEEKARRDAEELRQRLEAEMKAKLEAERKAREEADRKRREEEDRRRAEEDRKRREEEERRRKEEEERRAKEEAERKRREEEDRKRREADERRRKEEEERRAKEAKEAEERRAREEAQREADRKRQEDEERKRAEEEKRRRNEEEERRAEEAKEAEERRAREEAQREADRKRREDEARQATAQAEAKARAAQSVSGSVPSIQPVVAPPPPAAAGSDIGDSLLADLESFGQREEEEQKAKEEAERREKEAAARKAKEETERRAKDDAERRAKDEAEKKRHEQEERKAKEEAEQRAREEEERAREEEAERKRKVRDAERKSAQQAAGAKDAGKEGDDIAVTDDDLDLDDIKKDEKALSAQARKEARERELAHAAVAAAPRPKKWGKPAAIALIVLLAGGIGALHVMPISTADYEKAASDAMGVPVKISSARLSLITGVELKFEGVSIGDTVKIKTVHAHPGFGSMFDEKKFFSRIELEGASLSQSQFADAVLGKVSGANFRVGRVVIKQAKLEGPVVLPALDVDAAVSGDGTLQSVSLRGGDKLSVQLSPKGSDIGFEISAGSLALPFVPALSLSEFGMKGIANRGGVTQSEFDGRAFDGIISGSAKIRWGAKWIVEGEVRARGVKVAVIAPALVSEGKVDGRGAYTMSGPNPATLFESARMQGEFKIEKGVLGSFNLTRALQTGGAQTAGRTEFTELTGQVVYDKGAVKVSNVAISAGAMNAGASLDVDANGGLSGRIVADVKTPNQTLRAILNVSGKLQDPVIRK